jgi:hypothetical protein
MAWFHYRPAEKTATLNLGGMKNPDVELPIFNSVIHLTHLRFLILQALQSKLDEIDDIIECDDPECTAEEHLAEIQDVHRERQRQQRQPMTRLRAN